eukprot:g30758.t1
METGREVSGIWHCYWEYSSLKGKPGSDIPIYDIGFQMDFRVYLQLRQTWLAFINTVWSWKNTAGQAASEEQESQRFGPGPFIRTESAAPLMLPDLLFPPAPQHIDSDSGVCSSCNLRCIVGVVLRCIAGVELRCIAGVELRCIAGVVLR